MIFVSFCNNYHQTISSSRNFAPLLFAESLLTSHTLISEKIHNRHNAYFGIMSCHNKMIRFKSWLWLGHCKTFILVSLDQSKNLRSTFFPCHSKHHLVLGLSRNKVIRRGKGSVFASFTFNRTLGAEEGILIWILWALWWFQTVFPEQIVVFHFHVGQLGAAHFIVCFCRAAFECT